MDFSSNLGNNGIFEILIAKFDRLKSTILVRFRLSSIVVLTLIASENSDTKFFSGKLVESVCFQNLNLKNVAETGAVFFGKNVALRVRTVHCVVRVYVNYVILNTTRPTVSASIVRIWNDKREIGGQRVNSKRFSNAV